MASHHKHLFVFVAVALQVPLLGQLGAGVSAGVSLLVAATHTINSAPLSVESVTMFAWLWGLWLGMDQAGQKKH